MARFPLASKIALLLGLALLLMLPISAIMSLIDERAAYRHRVIDMISASTSGEQTLFGPIVVVPYETIEWRGSGEERRRITIKHVLYFLPETLDATADAQVEERSIGIYQAQIYNSAIALTGRFVLPALDESRIPAQARLSQPYLSLAVGDARGIRQISRLRLDSGTSAIPELAFEAGSRIKGLDQGVHASLPFGDPRKPQSFDFSIDLKLQGTGSLELAPVGETSSFSLTSNWPHPNFLGSFLPERRTISPDGFSAHWSSSWFANNMNNRFAELADMSAKETDAHTYRSAVSMLPVFSASLVETVDQYRLNERIVKYAALFISLTFAAFFIFEMLKALRVHPIQYLLIGAALVLFYLLLLALSEHIGFNAAYVIASLACIGLITYYVSHILKSLKRGAGFGLVLAVLYAALWGLLQSEDHALLLGSLLLFGVLAAIMALTRKVNWYSFSEK